MSRGELPFMALVPSYQTTSWRVANCQAVGSVNVFNYISNQESEQRLSLAHSFQYSSIHSPKPTKLTSADRAFIL